MRSNNIAATKGTGWKQFKGEEFPPEADAYFKSQDIWRSGYGSWVYLYYKGDSPQTATAWCVVMDDGGYYKVFAQWIVFYTNEKTGNINSHCVWTAAHLDRTLKAYFITGNTLPDPNYHT